MLDSFLADTFYSVCETIGELVGMGTMQGVYIVLIACGAIYIRVMGGVKK